MKKEYTKKEDKSFKDKYIDPVNPNTGNVSLFAIMENIKNGYTKFPYNYGKETELNK